MQCPKCSYENPSGIRYCLNCGAKMIPPVPEEKKAPLRESKKTTLITMTLLLIGLVLITGGILFGLLVSGSSGSSAPQKSELAQGEAEPYASTQDESAVYQFVDFSTGTLTLPGSKIQMGLPDFYDYRFDYDEARQFLVFEIDTQDGMTITVTSSSLNASPYTKSEAEASQKTGLYHSIEGKEDLYYYILPPNGPTANATIIDCLNNTSTNITVYDKRYAYLHESHPVQEEKAEEDQEQSESALADDSNGSMGSSAEIPWGTGSSSSKNTSEEAEVHVKDDLAAEATEENTETVPETEIVEKPTFDEKNSQELPGSQSALTDLENLLETTGIGAEPGWDRK